MATPLNVLIIEDNTGDILLIRQYLLREPDANIKLQTARSLEAGLDSIRSSDLDAILLDLSLPDSFGIETLTKVRKNTSHVPIIVISGFNDEETKLRALEQNAQDYLIKDNIDGKSLVRAIQAAIQHRQSD